MTARALYREAFVEACLEGAPPEARVWVADLEDLVDQVVRPEAARVDREAWYPKEAVSALAELGTLGVAGSKEAGGLGFGHAVAALAVETVAAGCPSTAALLLFHNQVVRRLEDFGGRAQRDTLHDLATGARVGASAWSELNAGADKSGMVTRAERAEDGWVVTGEKHFCTGLEGAHVVHVLTLTSDGGPPSFVQVTTAAPGVTVPEIYELMGLRGSSTGTLRLEDVRVADTDIIGGPRSGPRLMKVNHEVLSNPGLLALGIARSAYEAAAAAACGRLHRTQDSTSRPAVRLSLADMETAVGSGYAYATHVVRLIGRGTADPAAETAKIKAFASMTAVEVATAAVRLAGARGFSSEWPFERHLRDAQATVLMGPGHDLTRETIAQQVIAETTKEPA